MHTSFQLKPSCYASVMGRSATASAMKDNIIKLDVSGSKANSLSTVIRVMHWHSPPRGRFNCVQTRTHTLTCKQTHTPPRTFRVCVMLQLGGSQNKPVYCVRLLLFPLMLLSIQSHTNTMHVVSDQFCSNLGRMNFPMVHLAVSPFTQIVYQHLQVKCNRIASSM